MQGTQEQHVGTDSLFSVMRREEIAALRMQQWYHAAGYSRYQMSKFEEYDLYVENKEFLISGNVITFTDTDGRLMALKPDVTLSIVRNYREETGVQKVYYNENVYRQDRSTQAFCEIMQVGLECIGDIDAYLQGEVVTLACQSLHTISDQFVLNLSHMGLIGAVLEQCGAHGAGAEALLRCIGEKNRHEARQICLERQWDAEPVCALIDLYGEASPVLEQMRQRGGVWRATAEELGEMVQQLHVAGVEKEIQIDFSVINDSRYYTGVVFQGFVNGVPQAVLSGGRYDKLLARMNKRGGAIGFAVYLDTLEYLETGSDNSDFDVFLQYDNTVSPATVAQRAQALRVEGKTVFAAVKRPEKWTFGTEICMTENNLVQANGGETK